MKSNDTICDSCGEYQDECQCQPNNDSFRKRLWIEVYLQAHQNPKLSVINAADCADFAVDRFDKFFTLKP